MKIKYFILETILLLFYFYFTQISLNQTKTVKTQNNVKYT